jgi:hypothetical protein
MEGSLERNKGMARYCRRHQELADRDLELDQREYERSKKENRKP